MCCLFSDAKGNGAFPMLSALQKKNVCTFIVALYVRTIFGDGVIELYIIETGASAQFAHANQDAPSTLVPPA